MAAEQEYRYQGPPSGILLAGADGAAREEMLVAGRELRLPAGDPQVAELVARGHLAPASAAADADTNRETENR